MEISGESELWQEKQEIENPKVEEDSFVPAKEAQMNPDNALVYIEL